MIYLIEPENDIRVEMIPCVKYVYGCDCPLYWCHLFWC